MIPLTVILAGTVVIAFSGALGYVVGKMSANAERMAEKGENDNVIGCFNCCFLRQYDGEEPCDDCINYSEWEPMETAKEDEN